MEPMVLPGGHRVRPATAADAADIIRLIKALATYEKEEDKALLTPEQLTADGFGPQPLFFCLLAETNEPRKVVGFSLYFYIYSTWAGRAMHLEDLYIDSPYRKLGLGKALLRATAADAVRRGCARLNLQVLDWNTPSIQFYDSVGGKPLKEWLTYRWEGVSLKQLAGSQ